MRSELLRVRPSAPETNEPRTWSFLIRPHKSQFGDETSLFARRIFPVLLAPAIDKGAKKPIIAVVCAWARGESLRSMAQNSLYFPCLLGIFDGDGFTPDCPRHHFSSAYAGAFLHKPAAIVWRVI